MRNRRGEDGDRKEKESDGKREEFFIFGVLYLSILL